MAIKFLNSISTFLKFIIYLIETIEYHSHVLDENDPSKKIINTIDLEGFYVLSDSGYVPMNKIHITQPYKEWTVKASDKTLICANEHRLFDENFNECFVDELSQGSLIQMKNGVEKIDSINKSNTKVSMFDITVDHPDHRYYSNDFLSHQTVTSSMFIAWYLCFHSDRNIMVVANKLATTSEIVDKIKTILKNLPYFMKPGIVTGGVTGMRFDNGNRLFSQATTKTAAIGFTIHLLFADEFAHIHANFLLPFYRSIYPTLSSSKVSRMIICSTPNGMNLFYEIYQAAVERRNNFAAIRVDWWQVPGRDEKWKAQEIANLGSEELFNQEYGNQFLASSRLLFDSHTLQLMKRTSQEFTWREIDTFIDFPDMSNCLRWHPDFDPTDNDNLLEKFVFTVDIGDGVGRDYSIINIMHLVPQSISTVRKTKNWIDETSFFRLRQVGIFRSNVHSVEELAKMLELLIFNLFNCENCKIVLEINFKGHIVFEKIQRNKEFFPEIFLYTRHSMANETLKLGIKLQKDNRESYCRELRNLVKDKKIVLTENRTFVELSSFGINSLGRYESQLANDDVAMSVINLVSLFDTTDYYDMVEDIYDKTSQIYRSAVDKVITSGEREVDDLISHMRSLNGESVPGNVNYFEYSPSSGRSKDSNDVFKKQRRF